MKNINFLFENENLARKVINDSKLDLNKECLVRIHASKISGEDAVKIAKSIKNIIDKAVIVGCAVAEVIYDGYVFENKTLISILQFDDIKFRNKIINIGGNSHYQLANDISKFLSEEESNFSMLFFGRYYLEINEVIQEVEDKCPNIQLVGGTAGYFDKDNMCVSYIFDETNFIVDAISLVCFDIEKSRCYSNVVIGHCPIGDENVITAVDGEYINEINNIPANEWLKDFFGFKDDADESNWNIASATEVLFKFPIILSNKNDASRFIQYEFETNRIKLYNSQLLAGEKFKVGYLSPHKSMEEWSHVCFDLQEVFAEEVFCYSSHFRRKQLKNLTTWENKLFKKAKISGAFLLGNIGTKKGVKSYYNGSCSFFTLADKENHVSPNLENFGYMMKSLAEDAQMMDTFSTIHKKLGVDKSRKILGLLIEQEEQLKAKFSENDILEDNENQVKDESVEKPVDEGKLHQELKMVSTLSEIIAKRRVVPFFQGIYDNRRGKFASYEALMRLKDSDGNILEPQDFLEVAHKYDLYLKLSLIMVLKVIDLFADREEVVSINITAEDIKSEDFQSQVFERLKKVRDCRNFIFEILEIDSADDYATIRTFIHKAKQYGAKIAIDDIGIENSNFIEIGNLDVDYIKVSGSLVSNMDKDNSQGHLLESIFYLMQKTKIELVAKKVETVSMQKQMVSSGISYSQGYLFSLPTIFDEMRTVFKTNSDKKNIDESFSELNNIFSHNRLVKRQSKILYWGGVICSIIAVCAIIVFASMSQNEVHEMNDTYLVELSMSLSERVSLKLQDSMLVLNTIKTSIETKIFKEEQLFEYIRSLKSQTSFDELYIYTEDNIIINCESELLTIDQELDSLPLKNDEIEIIAPITILENSQKNIFFVTPIYIDGLRHALLIGSYNTDSFAEILNLKTFGKEAFYHICTTDGTPIVLSGNSDNLFREGDMYDFIGSLEIKNGHTPNSLREDMSNGETAVLKYLTNEEERTAVMTSIAGFDWCLVSILLDEITVSMAQEIIDTTWFFTAFIIMIFGAYFLYSIYAVRKGQTNLMKALESSYYLTNSLKESVETDVLTKVYSRSAATEKIDEAIRHAITSDTTHALALIDVDNFKYINDTYGHQAGDVYLKELVAAIKKSLRAGDVIGRIGGDEFIILLSNVNRMDVAQKVINRILENTKNIDIKELDLGIVGVSIGVAMIPEDGTNYDALSHKADIALYKAKNAGKNRYMIYEEDKNG